MTSVPEISRSPRRVVTALRERGLDSAEPLRILLVTNIPTPYRLPLFEELGRQLRSIGAALTVAFGAPGYARRKWKVDLNPVDFRHVVLDDSNDPTVFRRFFVYPKLLRLTRQLRPAVVITSGFSIASTKVWTLSLVSGTRYILWSGAVNSRYRRVSPLRTLHRRAVARTATACVAYGQWAKEYLVSLGVPSNRIFIGINTVDTAFYAQPPSRFVNIPKKKLLFVGELNHRKRADLVIRAVALLSKTRRDFELVIIGDGSEKANLEQLAASLQIGSLVTFQGFRQKEEIADQLREALVFLFPTDFDIWGLVLVEAMAAAVCCMSSLRAGATHDLISDGDTGFSVDFHNIEQVSTRLSWLLDRPDECRRIGRNAQDYILQHASLPQSARGFADAISLVLDA